MAKTKYIDYKKMQAELFKRTESYAAEVRIIYQKALGEIINLVKGTELEAGKPFSFSEYGFSEEVTPILRRMYSQTYQAIRSGVQKEWLMSNENNDGLVKAIFGEHSIEDNHFARFFHRNMKAMDAFFARKTAGEGLDLSQRVWRYTGMYKTDLENTLDLAIGEGTPAARLASKIQMYLQEPDRFYRRFRVRVGTDEDGKPIYGRIWKRRVFDKETQSYKWIDEDRAKYHPGRGVYRSSYRNAQRLARSETNIAYRTADHLRWQELDFVIGQEVCLSNNHPEPDICDDLKGVYPKDFKFTGWHPNCRCYVKPILASEQELDEMLDNILDGEDPGDIECEDEVTQLPSNFNGWLDDNQERIEAATARGTLPYFIRDNMKMIGIGMTESQANVPNNAIELIYASVAASLRNWYSENLPSTPKGRRFEVQSSDGESTYINRRFYEECISKYKDDSLYPIKLYYAERADSIFPEAAFVRSETTEHYANTTFKVYQIEVDGYVLEFKCKVDYNGCFLHILRIWKSE